MDFIVRELQWSVAIVAVAIAGCAAAHEPLVDSPSYTVTLVEVSTEGEPDSTVAEAPDGSELVGMHLRVDFDLDADVARVTGRFEQTAEFDIVGLDPIILAHGEARLSPFAGTSASIERIELDGRIVEGRVELLGSARVSGQAVQVSGDVVVGISIRGVADVSPDDIAPEVRFSPSGGADERVVLLPWQPIRARMSEPVELPPTMLGSTLRITPTDDPMAFDLRPLAGDWTAGSLTFDFPSVSDRAGNVAPATSASFWVPGSAGAPTLDFADGFGDAVSGWGGAQGSAPEGVVCDGCATLDSEGAPSGIYARLTTPTRQVRVRFRVLAEMQLQPSFIGPAYMFAAVLRAEDEIVSSPEPERWDDFTVEALPSPEGVFTHGGPWRTLDLELAETASSTEIVLELRRTGGSNVHAAILVDEIVPL